MAKAIGHKLARRGEPSDEIDRRLPEELAAGDKDAAEIARLTADTAKVRAKPTSLSLGSEKTHVPHRYALRHRFPTNLTQARALRRFVL